jgi:hypothetical protein
MKISFMAFSIVFAFSSGQGAWCPKCRCDNDQQRERGYNHYDSKHVAWHQPSSSCVRMHMNMGMS